MPSAQYSRDVLKLVAELGVWKQGDTRAPHKPLLFLLALGRLLRGEERLVRFEVIEEQLTQLLRSYGPPRKTVHPEYPFWWLRTDQLWEIPSAKLLNKRRASNDPTRTSLREHGEGGFPSAVDVQFRKSKRLARQAIAIILNSHFPSSLHERILTDVGIEIGLLRVLEARDAEFRLNVISAYDHRCAVCDFDVRVDSGGATVDIALEAAHVKWRQAGGPDIVQNGLALCSIHHKALDTGAIAIDGSGRVVVSTSTHGTAGFSNWFMQFHRKALRLPHSKSLSLEPTFARWHYDEVFRGNERD